MRKPDFIIGTPQDPYLERWWIIPRNKWFNIYLHCFHRSDDDRALHDHPYYNMSILLKGFYLEHFKDTVQLRRAWSIVGRRATTAHRIELIGDNPVWSLFFTGPRIREWGFHCPDGWRHWAAFTKPGSPGEIGPGCN